MWKRLQGATRRAPSLIPPKQLPSRLATIPQASVDIDNALYQHDDSWHKTDTHEDLATLHLLNSARVPYFDRTWRAQLGLTPPRPGVVLEVGCGGGGATVALAKLGYHMTGVDPAARALAAAREHARECGVSGRVSLLEGNTYDLSALPSGTYDGVVMADVLEHLLDLPAALREVGRVLRPGGVLVFDTINRTYRSYLCAIVLAQDVFRLVPPHCHDWRLFIKPEELSFVLQSHGFRTDSSLYRGMAPSVRKDPLHLIGELRRLPEQLPQPPLGDFREIESLAINYMGWAVKSCDGRD